MYSIARIEVYLMLFHGDIPGATMRWHYPGLLSVSMTILGNNQAYDGERYT